MYINKKSPFYLFIAIIFLFVILVLLVEYSKYTLFTIFLVLLVNIIFISFLLKRIRDYISPPFLIIFLLFMSYIFPVVLLLITKNELYFFKHGRSLINEQLIQESIILTFIVFMSFVIGMKINFSKLFIRLPRVSVTSEQNVSHIGILLFFVSLWFTMSGVIRVKYLIGSAGNLPLLPYAGFFKYFLYDGNLVLYALILSNVRTKKYFLITILVGLIIVFTQALLGWRGAIFHFFIITISIYLINKDIIRLINFAISKKIIIICLLFFIPFFYFLADSSRNSNLLNRESNTSNLSEKILLRQQGLTRLLVILKNNSSSYSILNLETNERINKSGLSTTKFVDYYYHNISMDQIHSVGASGIGSIYIRFGIIGLFVIFSLTGMFYISLFSALKETQNNFFLIVYVFMILQLFQLISENYNNSTPIVFFVVVSTYLFWSIIIRTFSRISKIKIYN